MAGEAKRRGPKEVRIAQGVAKRQAELVERQKKLEEAEAALTPEEKEMRHKNRMLLATVMGIMQGARNV